MCTNIHQVTLKYGAIKTCIAIYCYIYTDKSNLSHYVWSGESPRPVYPIEVLLLLWVKPTFNTAQIKQSWERVAKEGRLWGKEFLFLSEWCFWLAKWCWNKNFWRKGLRPQKITAAHFVVLSPVMGTIDLCWQFHVAKPAQGITNDTALLFHLILAVFCFSCSDRWST